MPWACLLKMKLLRVDFQYLLWLYLWIQLFLQMITYHQFSSISEEFTPKKEIFLWRQTPVESKPVCISVSLYL